jgi:hypothetical protein
MIRIGLSAFGRVGEQEIVNKIGYNISIVNSKYNKFKTSYKLGCAHIPLYNNRRC